MKDIDCCYAVFKCSVERKESCEYYSKELLGTDCIHFVALNNLCTNHSAIVLAIKQELDFYIKDYIGLREL